MKKQLAGRRFGAALVKMLFFSLLVLSCKEEKVVPRSECSSLDIEKPYTGSAPYYNLNVYFKGSQPTACGYVEFRQTTANAQFIHLDTWVHGLEPNSSYMLQRAVDTTIDGNCTSTDWLTLGKGTAPETIKTDAKGAGYAELFRSVAMIPVGTTFDIHFQIIKESDASIALSSDCYQYTVR